MQHAKQLTAYVIGLAKTVICAQTGYVAIPSAAELTQDMQLPQSMCKYATVDLCTKLGTVTGAQKSTVMVRAAKLAAKHLIRRYEIFYLNLSEKK